MKTTEKQNRTIECVLSIIEAWKDLDIIESSAYYTEIEETLYTELEDIVHKRHIECLNNGLIKLFDRISNIK